MGIFHMGITPSGLQALTIVEHQLHQIAMEALLSSFDKVVNHAQNVIALQRN